MPNTNSPDQTANRPQEKADDKASGDPSSPEHAHQTPIRMDHSLVHQPTVEVKAEGFWSRIMTGLRLRQPNTFREDLSEALEAGGAGAQAFSPEERAMITNILRLRERRVEDVMVPRAEVRAVDRASSLADVLACFEETGHSRLPVYDENLDDPRGMVLVKDLLLYMTAKADKARKESKKPDSTLDLGTVDLKTPLADTKIVRRVLFVPPSMLAADLMTRMQTTRTQMALVIDEYGGTDGLVSLEDIVEEVVGEIEDEHDDEDGTEPQIKADGDGLWTVDARMDLDKVSELLGVEFEPGELGEDVDTLGGLVYALAGTIPVRGEVVTGLPGYEFRILEADPRRIRKLRIVQTSLRDKRRKAAAAANAANSAGREAAFLLDKSTVETGPEKAETERPAA